MPFLDRRKVAVLAALLVSLTGCGRMAGVRATPDGSAEASPAVAAMATPGPTTEPTEAPTDTMPPASASSSPDASPSPKPEPSTAPLSPPDLGDIEDLLNDLDAALGADATADADEGSP